MLHYLQFLTNNTEKGQEFPSLNMVKGIREMIRSGTHYISWKSDDGGDHGRSWLGE